jgi:SM-20-related protein
MHTAHEVLIQPDDPALSERIADALASDGWIVLPKALSTEATAALAAEIRDQFAAGVFHRAGVGKSGQLQVVNEVRGDHVNWLEQDSAAPLQRAWLDWLQQLSGELNRHLYLGLQEFEGHAAIYPPGSFYKKHLDQFRGTSERSVTAILYLNQNWQAQDGGQLRLYLDDDCHAYRDIQPEAGTLVVFLAARFYHEVLTSQRERIALTGWFKRRSLR